VVQIRISLLFLTPILKEELQQVIVLWECAFNECKCSVIWIVLLRIILINQDKQFLLYGNSSLDDVSASLIEGNDVMS